MTNMEFIMEPDSSTLKLDNVVIRATDRVKQPGVYVVYLDISDKDGVMLGRYGKRLAPKKSKVSGMWYYMGYMDPKRIDVINGWIVSDGGNYFIPHIEFNYGYFVGGRPESFCIIQEDLHEVRKVEGYVYDTKAFDKTDISKEETKMNEEKRKYYDYTQASAAYRSAFGIEKVVYSPPATIVFWKDGSKTVVKCSENDVFDAHSGIAFALMRKVYGKEYRNVEKFAKEYEKLHPTVDISAMPIDRLDDLADTAMAGYMVSGTEYEAIVGNAPAKKVGEETVDDSELKPLTVGGEMVKKAIEDILREEEDSDNGAHE